MKISKNILVIASLAVSFLFLSACSHSDKSQMSDMKPAMETGMNESKYNMEADMKKPMKKDIQDTMKKTE